MSLEHFWFMHMFKNGVMQDEYDAELTWAQSRKLSMSRLQSSKLKETDADGDNAMQALVDHYGAERLSKVKDLSSACSAVVVQSLNSCVACCGAA